MPSEGHVDLTVVVYKDLDVQVNVVNLSGQVVYTYESSPLKLGRNQVHMDLSGLNSGIYFVNIIAEGTMTTEKLILK